VSITEIFLREPLVAANSYCEGCGKKGRTLDGLCHECYEDVVSEYRDYTYPEDEEDIEYDAFGN
jgi:predicted amidophosphoribosyltransferase